MLSARVRLDFAHSLLLRRTISQMQVQLRHARDAGQRSVAACWDGREIREAAVPSALL